MDKLDLESKNITNENIEKIAELFPNVMVESELGKSIDFDLLKQELSNVVVEGNKEKYQLTWPGKKEAIVTANTPTKNTLRPFKDESIDFDTTQNMYIEGDNLEVLKILQESYLNKIKCIYIDPPYNTGNDFIYNDKFDKEASDELEESGQVDELGNKLISNNQSNGRFHSDWLSMMYSRLKLSRNLLKNEGVIFISIDDSEQSGLKKICDEIFGQNNFISTFIWQRAFSPVNLKKYSSQNHDYILCYAKSIENLVWYGLNRTDEADSRYDNLDNDPRGPWTSGDFSVGPRIETKVYPIILPSGREVLPPSGRCWRVTKEKFEEMISENRVWFGSNGDGVPRQKRFLSDVKNSITPLTVWTYTEVGHSQEAKKELNVLFENKAYFDYPKSIKLLKRILQLSTSNEDIVLDFFSGSATTAHATLELNSEDNENRKFIMVQLPEKCDAKSEAFEDGYKNICEIGKERIRRAGKKIKKETNADIDYGFRVYKLDSSNIQDVYYIPDQINQLQIGMFESNIKEDRTSEDLLVQTMLDLGLTLDLKIEEKNILSNKVYFVAGNSLVACFDENIDANIIDEICKLNPLKIVFRDSCFKTDNDKINVSEKIKKLSPDTEVSVI